MVYRSFRFWIYLLYPSFMARSLHFIWFFFLALGVVVGTPGVKLWHNLYQGIIYQAVNLGKSFPLTLNGPLKRDY